MVSAATWAESAQVWIFAAQLVVLIIAAVVGWYQVREARRLREQQIRPFVVIDFEVEPDLTVYLEVSNLGSSLARDVRIQIDPPLESAVDVDVADLKMLREGIGTVAPGKVYRMFFDQGFRRVETDLPMNHIATLIYTDETGERRFKETLNLDLDQYKAMQFIKEGTVHDLYKQLQAINKTMEKWGWRSGNGLITMTPEMSRQEEDRMVEERQKRHHRREGSDQG